MKEPRETASGSVSGRRRSRSPLGTVGVVGVLGALALLVTSGAAVAVLPGPGTASGSAATVSAPGGLSAPLSTLIAGHNVRSGASGISRSRTAVPVTVRVAQENEVRRPVAPLRSRTSTTVVLAPSGSPDYSYGSGWAGLNDTYPPNPCACEPPDTNGAVGAGYAVEMVNTAGAIWTESGTLLSSFTLNTFFNTSDTLSDPEIHFDPSISRWYADIISTSNFGVVFLAVSQGPDPTGAWNHYTVEMPNHSGTSGDLPDQTRLGFNSEAITLTGNDFYHGSAFQGVVMFVVNKTEALAGSPISYVLEGPWPSYASLEPALSQTSSNATDFLSSNFVSTTTLNYVQEVGAPPGAVHLKFLNYTTHSVTPGCPPTPGAGCVQTNDNRITSATRYGDIVWAAANDGTCTSGVVSCVHLWEFNTSSDTVVQDFTWSPPGVDVFYAAVSLDRYGDLGVLFSFSSSSYYPGVAVTGRSPADPSDTLEPATAVQLGTAVGSSSGRFGDYSGVQTDLNTGAFWGFGEWTGADWETRVQHWTFVPLYGVTFTESGLPSGSDWSVSLSGELNTSTSGSATFIERSGSYNYTVTAPSGYLAVPASGTVTVSGASVSVPVTFVLANSALRGLLGVYNARPDLRSAFPNAENNSTALFDLVSWAGGAVDGQYADSNYTTLAPYGYWYALMATYNERTDLQAAFPEAYSNPTNYTALVAWASEVVSGAFTDGAATALQPYGYYYDLMMLYGERSDLQGAYPSAYTNSVSYEGLVSWAGGVLAGLWMDGAYSVLEPYGYWYELMGTYLDRADLQRAYPDALTNFESYTGLVTWAAGAVTGEFPDGAGPPLAFYGYYYDLLGVYGQRSDLQSAFPQAYTNTASYSKLVTWAGDVVTGGLTDGANATLQPFGNYYDLMGIYGQRPDLQSAFPQAYASMASYTELVTWAGDVVTEGLNDGANATLQPWGYYYDLMGIYGQRQDLQAAFPQAWTNAVRYVQLLEWAKNVVEQVFPDGAYAQLEVYAAYYIANG